MSKKLALIMLVCLLSAAPDFSFADQLQLKERPEGNEVEVLGETTEAFVVKIPKGEVKLIRREKPTEIRIWRKKLILWEDQGDYLVISLPKEKLLSREGMEAGEYESPRTFSEAVAKAGWGTGVRRGGFLGGGVTGKVLKGGRPLANCRVKLVRVATAGVDLTRFLGRGEKEREEPGVFQTVTDADGIYLFNDVPIGDYDIYWAPQGAANWIHKLSDKPNITVKANQVVNHPDVQW